MAKQAGADPYSSWPVRFMMALLKRWTSKAKTGSGPILFSGKDAPRDLDDPLSDPAVQGRVGEAMAKQAQRRPK